MKHQDVHSMTSTYIIIVRLSVSYFLYSQYSLFCYQWVIFFIFAIFIVQLSVSYFRYSQCSLFGYQWVIFDIRNIHCSVISELFLIFAIVRIFLCKNNKTYIAISVGATRFCNNLHWQFGYFQSQNTGKPNDKKKGFGGTKTTKGIIKISNIGYGYLVIPQEGEL